VSTIFTAETAADAELAVHVTINIARANMAQKTSKPAPMLLAVKMTANPDLRHMAAAEETAAAAAAE
jgi:hypothetical protein